LGEIVSSRRDLLKQALLGGIGIGGLERSSSADPSPAPAGGHNPPVPSRWARGIEGQRLADLGNGTFLNPIFAGDHADPSILKDGEDYYMTFSSFEAYPALLIWHSRDLVNWSPLATALDRPLGSVFAVDLCKHGGRYFIYIPIIPTAVSSGMEGQSRIFVIHAERIEGPWSKPVALDIRGYIDPGHAVGEDGRRYLFLSGVSRVRLSDDGLAVVGPIEHAYAGWQYPDDWIVEAFALEGPKILRRGDWFYLISAVGGTAGPPTGHMVIAARSAPFGGRGRIVPTTRW
jgi:xylan 1,4-beta-xylosidase